MPRLFLLLAISIAGASAVLGIAGISYAHASDLIVNGQFKQGMPPWWRSTQLSESIRVMENPGAACLRSGYIVQEKIPVLPLRHYRLSIRARSQFTPLDSAFAQISFRGNRVDQNWRGVLRVSTPSGSEPAVFVGGGTHDWRPYTIVFDSPQNANELILYLRKGSATDGEVCYTDVSLEEVSEPVTSEAAAKQASLKLQHLPSSIETAMADRQRSRLQDLGRAGSPHPLTIAEDGKALAGIYTSTAADIITLNAASEIARYLGLATAGSFSRLHTDAAPGEGPMIIIGRDSELARSLLSESDIDNLGDDGFVIRSFGAHLVIAGKTPRGTMFGVFWFLDHVIGVKWLAPDATHIPTSRSLTIPPQNETQIPRFAYREVLNVEGQDRFWRVHNLMNGESHGPSFSPAPAEIDVFDRSWSAKGGSANFFELLPPQQFQTKHPDWYHGGQLAMMNTSMREALANAVIQRMRRLPDYRAVWFAVHDMDWGWDLDSASQAFAARHGNQAAAPRLDMMIDVANRVRAVLPDARLAFNAYHWSFTPPQGMQVPDYLLVYPMTIQVDYRTGLGEETNLQLAEDLRGWDRIARNVIVWDHVVNFLSYIQPHPNIRAIGRSIRWLSGLRNVRGYFAEGTWETAGGEFSCLRNWLISRLLWNPDQDVSGIVQEYTTLYYGPAGKYLLNYIDLEESTVATTRDRLTEKTSTDLNMFSLDFARKADQLFNEAEKAASGTVYLPRVQRERLAVDYIILLKAKEFQRGIDDGNLDWQLDSDNRSARFWKTIANVRLSRPYQGGDLAALRQMISIRRTEPTIPAFLSMVSRSDVVDLQDTSFFLFGPSRLVADPTASDGAAVRMAPKAQGWNVQLKMDKLPQEGSWRLFAAVRTTSSAPDPGSNPALSVGSHPPMNCTKTLNASATTQSSYRFVELPGGPFRFSTDHQRSIYFQPLRNEGLTDIFIDRVLAVRAGVPIESSEEIDGTVSNGCRSPQ